MATPRAGAAAPPEWYWKAKRGWEAFPPEDALALEQQYRVHTQHKRQVKQATTGRRSLDKSDEKDDHCYPMGDDNTISFQQMKQFRTYGDPSWFRSIHRGVPSDMPKPKSTPQVSAPDGGKVERKPRPPAKAGGAQQRTGSGRTLADRRAAEGWGSAHTAADAWVKEGALRKNEAARRAKTDVRNAAGGFSLRVLPCQDTQYKAVSTDMVRWFKLADEDPGAKSKAAAASRKPNTPESIRHLKRSLKQARVYKDVQSQSTVNLNAAAAQEAGGFDMVNCFSLPGGGGGGGGGGGDDGYGGRYGETGGLTGSGEVVEAEWDAIPPPSYSLSARTVGTAQEEDYERKEPWTARDYGTNWSQTKKPRPPPHTHGRQHVAAVTRSQQVPNQPHTGVRPEQSWASSSEASGWAAAVLGPSAADAGTERAGTGVGTFPPIVKPVGVSGEVVMSQRPLITYKFSPRFGTFGVG